MIVAPPLPPPSPVTANLSATGLAVDLAALGRALAALPPEAPVVVLIHGYRFQPGRPAQCPHRHILSSAPKIKDGREISWPQHLALDGQHLQLTARPKSQPTRRWSLLFTRRIDRAPLGTIAAQAIP